MVVTSQSQGGITKDVLNTLMSEELVQNFIQKEKADIERVVRRPTPPHLPPSFSKGEKLILRLQERSTAVLCHQQRLPGVRELRQQEQRHWLFGCPPIYSPSRSAVGRRCG